MNVIFTCGGTGGHINPAIAVANLLRERNPGCNILFIGAKGHMEEQLVPKAGYRLECLPGSGLSRGKNLAAIKKNVKAIKEGLKLRPGTVVIPFSAETKQGREEIWELMDSYVLGETEVE